MATKNKTPIPPKVEEDIPRSEQAPTLTKAARELRDRFVDEYFVDYDALAATVRIGYSVTFAPQYATQFMREPYVLQQIRDKEEKLGGTEIDQHKRRIVAGLYKEAYNRGPGSSHGARVNSLGRLASIFGIDAPVKTQAELLVKNEGPDVSHLTATELEAIKNQIYGSK